MNVLLSMQIFFDTYCMFELQQNTVAALELDFIRSVAKVFRSIESRKDFFW